jgi:hypothetical protein
MPTKIALAAICLLITSISIGQSPFNGISVQEVIIDQNVIDIAVDMEANMPTTDGLAGNVRCWRVYACMDDPYWELQVIYGDNTAPWSLITSTSFYQAVNGGFLANGVNPGFFPFEAASEYDSWFTIGQTYSSSTQFLPGSINPEITFELAGGLQTGFLVNDVVGSSVFGAWGPGASESTPDADNKVLIAQLTTDGIWSANINFQFRRLNPDLTIYVPATTVQVTGIAIDGTPGVEPDLCPIVFLPVELLSFHANAEESQVNLDWATATEINNDYFTVERSLDLENWEEVVKMPGAGTTQLSNSYFSIDPDPYTGVSYYRLKQTDYDGEFSHSNHVAVEFKENNYSVYPNPAADQVSVTGTTDNIAFFRITDSTGKLITEIDWQNSNREINLRPFDLSAGVYFVEIESLNGETQFEKLVVRR